MVWSKNKKNRYTYPCKPQYFYMKVGFNGVYFSWTCFPDACIKPSDMSGQLGSYHSFAFDTAVFNLAGECVHYTECVLIEII